MGKFMVLSAGIIDFHPIKEVSFDPKQKTGRSALPVFLYAKRSTNFYTIKEASEAVTQTKLHLPFLSLHNYKQVIFLPMSYKKGRLNLV